MDDAPFTRSKKEIQMFKRMSVAICVMAFALTTAGYAYAQGDAAADAATTAAVKTKLLADTKVGGLGIDVDTKDNVVTLTGKVRTTAERTEAVRLARTTTGVKDVVSKLVVDPTYKGVTDKDNKAKGTAGRAAENTKAEAKEAKADAKETKAEVKKDTKEAAGKAKESSKDAAQKTKDAGVKAKDATADASITSAVKSKLLADTKVGGLKIDVDTKDNVVTLTGTVNSAAEKAEAIRLAKSTTGVKSVVDKLVVK
jgi:hyperosmotically inducible periplasmic protein